MRVRDGGRGIRHGAIATTTPTGATLARHDYARGMHLAHTMLRVRDLDATLAFYTGFLGLREVRRRPIGDEATLVFLTDERGNHQIELTFNHDGRDYELGNQFGHLAFHVDDLEPVVGEIERRGMGYRRSKPESSSRYVFVKDPNGYDIEILERRAEPAPHGR